MNRKIRSSVSVPKGVGGWLLLLIVMLAVYTPVMGFRNLYYDFIVSARVLPALEANQAWVQSVSYTHLDVYKRQRLRR